MIFFCIKADRSQSVLSPVASKRLMLLFASAFGGLLKVEEVGDRVILDWDAGREMAVDRSAPRTAATLKAPLRRRPSPDAILEYDFSKEDGVDELEFAADEGQPLTPRSEVLSPGFGTALKTDRGQILPRRLLLAVHRKRGNRVF